jgi:hypothetical protein
MPDAKSLTVVTIIDQRKIITILLQSEVVKQHVCDFVISFRKHDSREAFRNSFPSLYWLALRRTSSGDSGDR